MIDASNGEVLLAVTMTRVGDSEDVLLFGSGYVDSRTPLARLPNADALVSFGVDSLAHALRQVDTERRREAQKEPPRPAVPLRRPIPSEYHPTDDARSNSLIDAPTESTGARKAEGAVGVGDQGAHIDSLRGNYLTTACRPAYHQPGWRRTSVARPSFLPVMARRETVRLVARVWIWTLISIMAVTIGRLAKISGGRHWEETTRWGR